MTADNKPLIPSINDQRQQEALNLQEELKNLGAYHSSSFHYALVQKGWPKEEAKQLSGYTAPSTTQILFTAFSAIIAIVLVYAETEALLAPNHGLIASNTDLAKSHAVREFMLITQLAGLQAEKTGGYALETKSSIASTEIQFSYKLKKLANLFLNAIYFWYMLVKLEYKLAKLFYYTNGPKLQQIFHFGVEEFIKSMTEITCILGIVMAAWKTKKAYAELKKHEASLQQLLQKKEELQARNASPEQIALLNSIIEKEMGLLVEAEKDVLRYGLAIILFSALFAATFYVSAPTIVMLTTILYLLSLSQDISSRMTAFATIHSDHTIAPVFMAVGKFLYHISGLSLLHTVKDLIFGKNATLFRASRSYEQPVAGLSQGDERIEARDGATFENTIRSVL